MADFFGGILDSISSVGDDVLGFFDSSIGQAVTRGIAGGTSGKKKDKINPEEGTFKMGLDTNFSPTQGGSATQSKDFHQIEIEWLKRMKKFSGLSDDTAVKLGAK